MNRKKIRILFTIPNFDTAGSGKALLNLASMLDHGVFEPHIACINDKGVFFQKVVASGIPVHLLPLYSSPRPITRLLKQAWALSRKVKAIAPDIVHSFNYAPDYTEAIAMKMAGCKWVFTKKNMNWGGLSANGWKLRSFLADNIVAQNTDMLKQFYPDSKKVTLIPRGVNTNEFHSKAEIGGLREKWKIDYGAKVVLNVANLVPVKGIEVLIQAFKNAKKLLPNQDIILIVVGDNDNEYGRELTALVERLEISDKVVFTGKQQNVSDYNSIADLFVLPTLDKGRREGSPVALLEAMASGNICIASDISGIRDQLSTAKDMLFEAGNVEALTKKLTYFLTLSDSEKGRLKERSRDIVLRGYTIELEVKRHEEFYLNCLKK